MILEITVILTLVFLYKYVLKNFFMYRYYKSKGIPTAKTFVPYFGEAFITKTLREEGKSFDYDYLLPAYQSNPASGMVYNDIKGLGQFLNVGDPQMAQDIISMIGTSLEKNFFMMHFFRRLFPNSFILMPTDSEWKKRRERCIPGLTLKNQRHHVTSFNSCIKSWIDILEKSDGKEIDLKYPLIQITNESLGRMIIGDRYKAADISITNEGEEAQKKLTVALSASLGKGFEIILKNFLFVSFPFLLDFKYPQDNNDHIVNNQRIHAKIKELIQDRMQELKTTTKREVLVADAFIKQMEAGEYTIDDAVSDIFMLIFAGQNSISYVLAVFLYRIHKHPEVLQKVLQEIKENILDGTEDIANVENYMNFKKIQNLPYISMVIKECLRIDHPANEVPHVATENLTLNGVKVSKGTGVVIQLVLLHNNPQEWHSPREFIPERFDSESQYYLTPSGEKRHPLSFMPFVVGPRNCVGQNVAQTFMKYAIVQLLCNFSFELSAEHLKSPARVLNTAMDPTLPMKITKRTSLAV